MKELEGQAITSTPVPIRGIPNKIILISILSLYVLSYDNFGIFFPFFLMSSTTKISYLKCFKCSRNISRLTNSL